MAAKFLTAEWNNLVMVNYQVPASLLQPFVPERTELDIFEGNVYISLVGFMFNYTCIKGIKIPFHVNFEEVNLRFYVRYKQDAEWRRGVVFIKEIVPKPAISFVANTLYHEKYQTMKMDHAIHEHQNEQEFIYRWKYRGNWNSLSAITEKISVPMQPGSKEEFIAEHYWGYSKHGGNTFEYAVQHPAWEIYPVKDFTVSCDFGLLYGQEFAFLANAAPDCVFVAKGSAIAVLGKRKL